MTEDELNLNPFGVSKTKRATAPEAEEILYKPQHVYKSKAVRIKKDQENWIAEEIPNPAMIRLVDYCGGDELIKYGATSGFGLGVVGNPNEQEFFKYLRKMGMGRSFKMCELKFHIYCPISDALYIVPYERASVNEYSGRYSVMSDDFNLPDASEDVLEKLKNVYRDSYEKYSNLLDLDFTRELARNSLSLANFTQFYWKISLEDLFAFITEFEKRNLPNINPYLEVFKDICKRVAPKAYEAFINPETDLGPEINFEILRKGRQIPKNPFGISETKRVTVQEAEELLFKSPTILKHGFCGLVDYMGTDGSIVQAARVSYGKGTKQVSRDRGLIRYLKRHLHTTPMEMIELTFDASMPMFVERQWVRHRTADKSSILSLYLPNDHFYMPDESEIRAQATINMQGRGDDMPKENKEKVIEAIKHAQKIQEKTFNEISLEFRDQVKGVGYFMVPWVWKNDLHNTLHFLRLRIDDHAQYEIQEYGRAMVECVKAVAPMAWESFEDYTLNAQILSSFENDAVDKSMDKGKFFAEIINKKELAAFEIREIADKFRLIEKLGNKKLCQIILEHKNLDNKKKLNLGCDYNMPEFIDKEKVNEMLNSPEIDGEARGTLSKKYNLF